MRIKMVIEISTIGGYNEVGKNMTAIKIGNSVVIMDMGLHIENYIRVRGEDDGFGGLTVANMQKADAVPDDRCIDDWKKNVKMIVPTHAHLDHVGAIPYMGNRYDAPVVGTPFTIEVIKTILRDEKIKIKNELKVLNANSGLKIDKDVSLEFVNITHSTPQTVVGVLHTPDGAVVYANDFKLDNNPTLGAKPNYDRLRELGKDGVDVLIVDGTRATRSGKTASESIARELLRDVMLGSDLNDGLIIVTTFSSHIARLKSIIEFGKKLNRKIVFLGRSLGKYVAAAEEIGLVSFSDEVEIVKYGNQVKRRLKQISTEKRNKYMLVVTGHQGEPESVLSRIATREIQFDLYPEDAIIFSCSVIPSPSNVANRELLESQLKKYKVRMFKDIHTSGHASKEDLRDMINMLKPRHIIPAHGDFTMISALTDLAMEMGYKVGENLHIMRNGQRIKI
jgi:ribonuclease J